MKDESLVKALQDKAQEDVVANKIFTAFCLRERDRKDLTVIGLSQTMNNLGEAFRRDQYSDFLKFLSSLGIGEIKRDRKGIARALVNIHLSLISIGKVATKHMDAKIEPFEVRNTFEELKTTIKKVPTPKVVAKAPQSVQLGLTFHINGKIIEIPIPETFGEHDVAKMILTLRGSAANA